jgi:choline dehydrogenase-like flavoprotein
MGSDPKTSVVNRYGQSWVANLFIIGSSTFLTMSGFNPTLTIQTLAYMSADAIVKFLRNTRPSCLRVLLGVPGRAFWGGSQREPEGPQAAYLL